MSNDSKEHIVAGSTGNRSKAAAAEPPPDQEAPSGVDALEGDALLTWAKQAFMHLNAGAKLPTDAELLALVPSLRAAHEEPEPEAEPAPADLAPGELPAEILETMTPAMQAFMALQMAQTAKLTEALLGMAEKTAGQQGREITLEGSVDDLVQQLSGTVSAGPPPENPLPQPVVFVSKGAMFKAVRKPRHRTTMGNGEQYFTTGITYDFAPMGRFTTVDPRAVEWLRARPGMNVEYWEETAPPHTAPDPAVILNQAIDLMFALDDAGLEKLLQEELASHKRKIVVDAINKAREKVQGYDA